MFLFFISCYFFGFASHAGRLKYFMNTRNRTSKKLLVENMPIFCKLFCSANAKKKRISLLLLHISLRAPYLGVKTRPAIRYEFLEQDTQYRQCKMLPFTSSNSACNLHNLTNRS
jgi:hypothetical protein